MTQRDLGKHHFAISSMVPSIVPITDCIFVVCLLSWLIASSMAEPIQGYRWIILEFNQFGIMMILVLYLLLSRLLIRLCSGTDSRVRHRSGFYVSPEVLLSCFIAVFLFLIVLSVPYLEPTIMENILYRIGLALTHVGPLGLGIAVAMVFRCAPSLTATNALLSVALVSLSVILLYGSFLAAREIRLETRFPVTATVILFTLANGIAALFQLAAARWIASRVPGAICKGR